MDDPDRDDAEVLDLLDRHLDPLVPPGPAPVTDLVRRGRARRARRRGLVAAVGAAAAVAVVAVAVTVAGSDTRPATLPPTDAPPTAGVRTVQFGGLALDIPRDWVPTDACGQSAEIAWGSSPVSCQGVHVAVRVMPAINGGFTGTTEQNGTTVVRSDWTCESNSLCLLAATTTVVVPDLGVEVVIGGPAQSRAVRHEIADTVRMTSSGLSQAEGTRLLGFDGVAVEVPENFGPCDARPAELRFSSRGCAPAPNGVSVWLLHPDDNPLVRDSISGVPRPQGGLDVIRRDGPCSIGYCTDEETDVAVVRDGIEVLVRISGPDGTDEVRERIADSVRAIAVGYAAVPPIDLPTDQGEVCSVVPAAGLRISSAFCNAFVLGRVTALDPPPGTIVARTTEVQPVTTG